MKVPGRLCLFGEHEDWVTDKGGGQHSALILPLFDLYIESNAQPLTEYIFRLRTKDDVFSVWLNRVEILQRIVSSSQYSTEVRLSSAVMLVMMEHFNLTHGIDIEIQKTTTLPMKAGLSSSAAFCVTLVKWCNEIYNLRLSDESIKYYAQFGENFYAACGSLDYHGVMASELICYDFTHDKIIPVERVREPIFLALAPIKQKNTKIILEELQAQYSQTNSSVYAFFEYLSPALTKAAIAAINTGAISSLGYLMNAYQAVWDECIAPLSPHLADNVTSSFVFDKKLQDWIWGGKGVGSHGDGAVQLLCRNKECQEQVIQYIKMHGYEAYAITI